MKEYGRLEDSDTFAVIGATIADNFRVKMPDGTDETGNADTELTDPENDPQEAAQEQLLETE